MTYVITTSSPDGDIETYHRVNAVVGEEPAAGLLHHFVGTGADGGLTISSVWESRAAADRFAAERLVPALRQVLGHDGGPITVIEFDVVAERVGVAG